MFKPSSYPSTIPAGGLSCNSATREFDLGGLIADNRGNEFRYIKANEALVEGDVVTAVAGAAWDATLVLDGVIAAGVTKIHVDTSTSIITVNQYAGYYVYQATAASKGMFYRIASHGGCAAGGEFDVWLDDTVAEAIADNAVLYVFNPFLVEKVDATTEVATGVAIGSITSGYYGFVQVGGVVKALKTGHSTSNATVLDAPLKPVGSGNEGAMQGMGTGTASADILVAGVNRLVALEAVGANTTGFIAAKIVGRL